jgi:hypothetical protein
MGSTRDVNSIPQTFSGSLLAFYLRLIYQLLCAPFSDSLLSSHLLETNPKNEIHRFLFARGIMPLLTFFFGGSMGHGRLLSTVPK